METNNSAEKWLLEGDDKEEALSLSDLPINGDDQSRKEPPPDDDFDFCSFLKESEMCAADEVFFQGQILPFRHSISSESGVNGSNSSRFFSRSESMGDCSYSRGGFSSGSSRSSSIRSHQSTSSGGSSATAPVYRPRIRTRNQFHSHPSPKPQIRFQNIKSQNAGNCVQKSRTWSLFRLGLLTPPEIDLEDLKSRSINNNYNSKNTQKFKTVNNNHSSRNSRNCGEIKVEEKKKQGFLLLGGCKCSVNAVKTEPSRVITIRRSASANNADSHEEMDQKQKQEEGKQELSRHRTFEWLKQLSLES